MQVGLCGWKQAVFGQVGQFKFYHHFFIGNLAKSFEPCNLWHNSHKEVMKITMNG